MPNTKQVFTQNVLFDLSLKCFVELFQIEMELRVCVKHFASASRFMLDLVLLY